MTNALLPDPVAPRTAVVSRSTAETKITVGVNLDGTGVARLHTGIGFLTICWTRLHATA